MMKNSFTQLIIIGRMVARYHCCFCLKKLPLKESGHSTMCLCQHLKWNGNFRNKLTKTIILHNLGHCQSRNGLFIFQIQMQICILHRNLLSYWQALMIIRPGLAPSSSGFCSQKHFQMILVTRNLFTGCFKLTSLIPSYRIIALVQRFIPTVHKPICKRDVLPRLPRLPTRTSKELLEEDQL